MQRLGFTENYQVPSDGLVGGIWLFWNPTSISINILHLESQLIHCKILQDTKELQATFAYVQPFTDKKIEFWNQAEAISRTAQGPWILMGDLNDIVFEFERAPQRNGSGTRSQQFREYIQACDLIDMEASGCKYTWIREQNGRATLRERLDRVLTNIDFRLLFSEAKSINLPRTYGDHHPVLLDTDLVPLPNNANKPQRFEAAWLLHSDFAHVFNEAWISGSELEGSIQSVQTTCHAWNQTVFENIFKRKSRLVARLS